MSSIVVMGACNVDLVVHADRFPATGETLLGNSFKTVCGGKAFNVAMQIGKLKLTPADHTKVVLVGTVGNDSFGDNVKAACATHAVDASQIVTVKDTPTGIAQICVAADGENQIVIVLNANGLVQVPPTTLLDETRILVGQLEIPLETMVASYKLAKQVNEDIVTVLNVSPVPDKLPMELLRHVNLLVINQSEADHLAKTLGPSQSDWLLSMDPKWAALVVTLGDKGCKVVEKGAQSYHVPAATVKDKIIDTTGAGDAFLGGLVYHMAANPFGSLKSCCEFGMTAAGKHIITGRE
eukprot:Platyproteum_vivax@DN432_c0_g1_i3.p1